jgi:hypothetical protein
VTHPGSVTVKFLAPPSVKEGTWPRNPGKENAMNAHPETSLHLRPPRGHALRDVALFASLLVVIAAFLAHSVRF